MQGWPFAHGANGLPCINDEKKEMITTIFIEDCRVSPGSALTLVGPHHTTIRNILNLKLKPYPRKLKMNQ